MTPDEALELAQQLYRAGHWYFENPGHVLRRMRERNATNQDLRNAVLNASGCQPGHTGRWLIEGEDLEGDSLTVVAEIRANLVIITIRE